MVRVFYSRAETNKSVVWQEVKGANNRTGSGSPSLGDLSSFIARQSVSSGYVNAYINWVLFDEQLRIVSTSSWNVQGAESINSLPATAVNVVKNGYLYVYCSNTSNQDVFFDNLQVIHNRGVLTEEEHYYAFGLSMKAISSQAANSLPNRYKFNDGSELQSGEFSDGSGLEWYGTSYRSLDPQLGRFWQIDPLNETSTNFTPYGFVLDNPILMTDFLGLKEDTLKPAPLPPVTVTSHKAATDDFLPYLNFSNNQSVYIARNSMKPLSFSKDRTNDLTDSWALGLGVTNLVFLPSHPMTKDMMNVSGVNAARLAFYKKYLQLYLQKKFNNTASLTNYAAGFGLIGLLNAGFNLTEQFVGDYRVDIYTSQDTKRLLFIVSDSKSMTSALYHLTGISNFERDPNQATPGGTTYQKYIWSEPVNFDIINSGIGRVQNAFESSGVNVENLK